MRNNSISAESEKVNLLLVALVLLAKHGMVTYPGVHHSLIVLETKLLVPAYT
jgi:hypothetical protein